MKIGIWTQDESMENQKRLFDKGFRGATIGCPYKDISWEEAVNKMYNERYLPLKQIGYTHFLLQMRSPDVRYQDLVIAKFKDCQDVEYLCGEPYELVEKELEMTDENGDKYFVRWSEGKLHHALGKLYEKIFLGTYGKLIIDIQLRLWNKFPLVLKRVPSSYFWQQRVWYRGMPFAWIYGQLAWHSFIPFIGSSSYKRLKREMDKKGITTAYLYQADEGKFTNLLTTYFQKKFTKVFNTMGEK